MTNKSVATVLFVITVVLVLISIAFHTYWLAPTPKPDPDAITVTDTGQTISVFFAAEKTNYATQVIFPASNPYAKDGATFYFQEDYDAQDPDWWKRLESSITTCINDKICTGFESIPPAAWLKTHTKLEPINEYALWVQAPEENDGYFMFQTTENVYWSYREVGIPSSIHLIKDGNTHEYYVFRETPSPFKPGWTKLFNLEDSKTSKPAVLLYRSWQDPRLIVVAVPDEISSVKPADIDKSHGYYAMDVPAQIYEIKGD